MKAIISIPALAALFLLGSCNRGEIQRRDAAIASQQRVIDSMNTELAKQKVIDSMNEVMSMQYVVPEVVAPAAAAAAVAAGSNRNTRSTRSSSTRSSNRNYSGESRSNTQQPVVYQQPVEEKKKGWSAKAKGAVIGAGTGAAAGAIINKRNRAAGAVIGGVLGAGAGTGVGAVIDKKKGR